MNQSKFVWIVALCILTLSSFSFAKKSNVLRGGFGFLFPDHNSFVNPGQLARDMGFGLELSYARQNTGGEDVSQARLGGSYSGKTFAIGAAAERSGTDITSSGTDTVDTGIGLLLGKRFTVGVRYDRGIGAGQVNDGNLTAGINLNPSKGRGFALGAAYKTTVNAVTNTAGAIVAFGFSGKNRNTNFEVDFELPDLDSTENYTGSAYFTYATKKGRFFLSGGYVYEATTADNTSSVKARLGALLGKKNPWDISVFATHTFVDGSNPAYGAVLRGLF